MVDFEIDYKKIPHHIKKKAEYIYSNIKEYECEHFKNLTMDDAISIAYNENHIYQNYNWDNREYNSIENNKDIHKNIKTKLNTQTSGGGKKNNDIQELLIKILNTLEIKHAINFKLLTKILNINIDKKNINNVSSNYNETNKEAEKNETSVQTNNFTETSSKNINTQTNKEAEKNETSVQTDLKETSSKDINIQTNKEAEKNETSVQTDLEETSSKDINIQTNKEAEKNETSVQTNNFTERDNFKLDKILTEIEMMLNKKKPIKKNKKKKRRKYRKKYIKNENKNMLITFLLIAISFPFAIKFIRYMK